VSVRIRKSLDVGSTATLVHAFVTSYVDYCNFVLAESPRSTTDKLQRVMNAAAHVISNTQKYDSGLSPLLHEELHWLDDIDHRPGALQLGSTGIPFANMGPLHST